MKKKLNISLLIFMLSLMFPVVSFAASYYALSFSFNLAKIEISDDYFDITNNELIETPSESQSSEASEQVTSSSMPETTTSQEADDEKESIVQNQTDESNLNSKETNISSTDSSEHQMSRQSNQEIEPVN